MSQWSISRDAQLSLLRLLIKAGLIDGSHDSSSNHDLERMSKEGYFPLRWFTHAASLDEQAAIRVLAERLKIPEVSFDRSSHDRIAALLQDKRLSKLEVHDWQNLRAVPLELTDRYLTVAFANPLDHLAVKSLERAIQITVRPAIAREEAILDILGDRQSAATDIDLASLVNTNSAGLSLHAGSDVGQGHFESTLTSADLSAPPIVRLVNKIIADAIQKRSSDIHVTPEKEILMVSIRVDGIMHPLFSIPIGLQSAVVSRIKLLAGMDIAERRRPQDGRMRVKAARGVKDLRISTVPTAFGESVVIRILSSDLSKMTLESLGVDPHSRHLLDLALKSSARVVLVTGPTGSGKSSTLYASLLLLHDGTNCIITVEDPIEYKIEGINQIQVNQKVGVTFAEGLRSILRQDPDVIMVGEVRDLETAEIAMQAAQTGHLVLSTLHTNTAASAFTRLRDLGLPAYVIASSIGTVVAQRLIRKLCPHCAVPGTTFSSGLQAELGVTSDTVKQAKGCPECDQSGYNGRIGIYSVLEVTEEVRDAIRHEKSEAEIEHLAHRGGFRTLLESGVALANQGVTSLEELERGLGSLELLSAERRAHRPPPTIVEAAQQKGPAASSSLSKRRVLLVEDDENTRLVLSMLLKREMFDVVEASDGVEALEKVYEQLPEIVVCDLMMPRMGGLEFVQLLKKDKRARSIPVLMLTAADAEENELSSLNGGADDFVSKTSDSRVMLARVHRLLEKSE